MLKTRNDIKNLNTKVDVTESSIVNYINTNDHKLGSYIDTEITKATNNCKANESYEI